jgi:non-specific serine/threonine protein kinase
LEVLYQLPVHGGAVVRKDELLESVLPDVTLVDGSLATAVSKLRKALGDDDSPTVLTVPRIGYRLSVPVNCKRLAAPRLAQLDFQPGDSALGRDQWRLVPLGKSEANEVRQRALKREVTLSRFLHESQSERAGLT